MDRDDAKRAYAALFGEVRAILNRHDLMRLIAIGAPAREYELEVELILPRLREASSPADVEVIVQDVFMQTFDQRQPESLVAAAANDIWAVYGESSVG